MPAARALAAIMAVVLVLEAAAEESTPGSAAGNCMGCFNATSGQCILDIGKPGCPLATPSDCAAINLPYVNKSLGKWPADGGCLAEVVAEGKACMGVLEKFECNGGATNAPNTSACAAMATAQGASYIGWIPTHVPKGDKAENCLIVTGKFSAGCAGCEGCQYWTYTELKTGETRHSCSYAQTRWACVDKQCVADSKGKPIGECEASC